MAQEKSCFTRKVFWQNPYLTELKVIITSVNGNDITVDKTIFYAFSGGQESDEGTIGGKHVIEAKKEDGNIIYTVENGKYFHVGDEVIMNIDWSRRYKLMKSHFAAEIILELIYKRIPTIKKTGAHISPGKSRMSFEYDGNLADILPEITKSTNEIINSNSVIKSDFSDEKNERRYWEIANFAKVPCCGTHLKSTGEIGLLEIKRKTGGKGKEKIEICLKNS